MRVRLLTVLLVSGLLGTSLFAVVANAGFPHVVDGTVGPSAAPGLGNPSNPAEATFYLVNKPAEPIQTEMDIQDADGTNLAYYGTLEVGSGWTWAVGDEVLVVVETVRGQNGWASWNYTTSSDGFLTAAGVDTLSGANVERIPTLVLIRAPNEVNVTWTGLLDGNTNIVDYTVERAPSLAGPWATAGRSSPQVANGAVWYADPRPPGNWCYRLGVNYRRDAVSGIYTTAGRSEPSCANIGTAPFIQTTTPADGDTGVSNLASIVVTFNEAMNPATMSWTLTPPDVVLTGGLDGTGTILTLTHAAAFTDCRRYTVLISGRDVNDDFPLVPGPVPNPFNFTTSCVAPQITLTDPADGETGVLLGADIVIIFSEPMQTGTVTYTFSDPGITFTEVWNSPTNTFITLSHTTPFAECQAYTVNVTAGRDVNDNLDLVPGPVSNPWPFTALCTDPFIASTSPAAGATNVQLDANIVITFSEPMNTGTVTYTFSAPAIVFSPSWNPAETVLTLTHATAFASSTAYTVTVTAGQDKAGRALVPGPVLNPWTFTTGVPPTVSIASPLGGECWTGRSLHDIAWTMSDDLTPVGSLTVWINYTSSDGNGVILGPATGRTSPDTYTWTVPAINATDVRVRIDVLDALGLRGSATSNACEIDSTAPVVSSVSPADATTDVATDADIVITFSEAMAGPATEGAITVSPSLTSPAFGWSAGNTVLTITHGGLTLNTPYTVTIGSGARDDCNPGMTLQGAPYSWTFTTVAAVARTPSPPTALTVTDRTTSTISLQWTAPTTYTDGSALLAADIAGYYVYRSTSPTGTRTNLTASAVETGTTRVNEGLAEDTTYYYWVVVVLDNGRVSADSNMASGQTLRVTPPPADYTWLWILLIILIVVIVLALFLWSRRKKAPVEAKPKVEAKAPPEEAAPAEEAPAEETVAEEPAAEGEAGERFVACPNCGTMVKPTDAECFVCGARM